MRYRRTRDADCLGQLYERYTHLVYSVAMKYLRQENEAEDIVMLIFEKLFDELKTADVRVFKGWLYTITKNQCLMHLRHGKTVDRGKQEILRKLEEELMEFTEGKHHLSGNHDNEDTQLLEKAILTLNEPQRKCIELFYLQEKSYREVAEMSGFTLNEVKSHLQNGKRNLKIFIEKARES